MISADSIWRRDASQVESSHSGRRTRGPGPPGRDLQPHQPQQRALNGGGTHGSSGQGPYEDGPQEHRRNCPSPVPPSDSTARQFPALSQTQGFLRRAAPRSRAPTPRSRAPSSNSQLGSPRGSCSCPQATGLPHPTDGSQSVSRREMDFLGC